MKASQQSVDILENEILRKYPEVLDILLCDRTTNGNIVWATDNYHDLGDDYYFSSQIYSQLITGPNSNIIRPRVSKKETLKNARAKVMAEVYTPAWVCNAQNNRVDNVWFQAENVFNTEVESSDSNYGWKVNPKKIVFPKNKSWMDYVKNKRLEIACGEAPYITSRYDTTTGNLIPIKERVGILDRKLRVINENVNTPTEWLKAAQIAFKSTYAYELQGDSLLLAREAMLYAFIENYTLQFGSSPSLKSIQNIAHIISWNVWQMDGLSCVIPDSCAFKSINPDEGPLTNNSLCVGCINNDVSNHSGVYCKIKDWSHDDNKNGEEIRFIDLIEQTSS